MTLIRTTAALVAWMEELYLSEFVLLAARPAPRSPAPKRPPAGLTIELGLPDHEYEGARDRFRVFELAASSVLRWELEGKLDKEAELTVEAAPEVDAPIALRLRAGGTALLACGAIEAAEGEAILRKARPRPWQHDFTIWTKHETATVADLLRLAQAGPSAALCSFDEPPLRADPTWTLASLRDRSARAFRLIDGARELASFSPIFRHEPGLTLGVQRHDADDEQWERLWRLPSGMPAEEVSSRTLRVTPEGWARWSWRQGAGSHAAARVGRRSSPPLGPGSTPSRG